jgi:S-adenosylmethionine:tRNA ribosyltransferase-isomerase
MHISEFDYELPEELIAQHPLPERDASRMLVVERKSGKWKDTYFKRFSEYPTPGDAVVINNTRVFPARLIGSRERSGGRIEILLVRQIEPDVWEALVRPGKRLKEGALVMFSGSSLQARVLNSPGTELRRLQFSSASRLAELMETQGEMPLPPYIKRPSGTESTDRERYQTVFAREPRAIAAPTAGLHFTPGVLDQLNERGVHVTEITLHVGYGTFEPVRVSEVSHHRVRPEVFEVTNQSANIINKTRESGHRVIAVGTTTTRALESSVDQTGRVVPTSGTADLTITPGYEFHAVDGLLTNFHLPQSSLLLLVCAFAGKDLVLRAYRHAVARRYRFYSYGDCMLIV